jgi:hypothetical protein
LINEEVNKKFYQRLGFEGSNFRLIKSYQNLILVGYENSIDVYDANTATKVSQLIFT